MSELVGYKLINADGLMLLSWGGKRGFSPPVPDYIDLPNGDRVYSPQVNIDYDGVQLIEWRLDSLTIEELRASMVCTPFQGRMALNGAGLLAQVQAMIDNPATAQETKLAWEYAIEWRRTSPMISALMAALGVTDEQADALFENAATIQA